MKILYCIQATGNGHISRAIELLPYLIKNAQVDVFLSGANSSLRPDLPIKFRSDGLSLFYKPEGNLHWWKIIKQINPFRLVRDAIKLPVKEYDHVIIDYEFIGALACKLRGKSFLHIGNQASFASKLIPRPPKRHVASEWVLKNYCASKFNIGYHYNSYEDWILPPTIKQHFWDATPTQNEHVTVYLPHISKREINRYFYALRGVEFHIFHPEVKEYEKDFNVHWFPIDGEKFDEDLITSKGVITAGGFQTTAEALFLGKPLLIIPIPKQYEQWCNAEALKEFDVEVVETLNLHFEKTFRRWFKKSEPAKTKPKFIKTEDIANRILAELQSMP